MRSELEPRVWLSPILRLWTLRAWCRDGSGGGGGHGARHGGVRRGQAGSSQTRRLGARRRSWLRSRRGVTDRGRPRRPPPPSADVGRGRGGGVVCETVCVWGRISRDQLAAQGGGRGGDRGGGPGRGPGWGPGRGPGALFSGPHSHLYLQSRSDRPLSEKRVRPRWPWLVETRGHWSGDPAPPQSNGARRRCVSWLWKTTGKCQFGRYSAARIVISDNRQSALRNVCNDIFVQRLVWVN